MSAGPALATMLLDPVTWDLMTDGAGNIALAPAGAYALEQDVASACMLFQGEAYYDTTQGVPYNQQIMGRAPSAQVFMDALETAALTVPGVATATVVIAGVNDVTGQVTGQIEFTTTDGNTGAVGL